MRFQLTLNKTFCPTPPLPTHQRLKHRQRTKNFVWFSTQSPQYQNWKANKYAILTITELEPPVTEFSAKFQNALPALILNTNLIKRELKIDYP